MTRHHLLLASRSFQKTLQLQAIWAKVRDFAVYETTDKIKSKRRNIPDFFIQQVGAKVQPVESPNFVVDKSDKQILIGKTIFYNLKNAPTFIQSLNQIHQLVSEENPDIILNFYDLLGGFYNIFWLFYTMYANSNLFYNPICIILKYIIYWKRRPF